VVRSERRDALAAALAARAVGTLIHYPVPPHRQPPYVGSAAGRTPLPVADRLAAEVLSLPMGPHVTPAQADRVVDAVGAVAPGLR
jgi:dTDP-3-amino-3,4,6-trideoxy-alpha-D-glucose transaminase